MPVKCIEHNPSKGVRSQIRCRLSTVAARVGSGPVNSQQSTYLLDKALEGRQLVVAQEAVEVLVEDELLCIPRGWVIVGHLLCVSHQSLQQSVVNIRRDQICRAYQMA